MSNNFTTRAIIASDAKDPLKGIAPNAIKVQEFLISLRSKRSYAQKNLLTRYPAGHNLQIVIETGLQLIWGRRPFNWVPDLEPLKEKFCNWTILLRIIVFYKLQEIKYKKFRKSNVSIEENLKK